ncbi:hypothetical protein ACJRO7_033614 [Eucalyptus globulus]|uniref:Uncharacterized protein n=1 Tax=Eucalyptus globulus TaxID=34317 RepID=A0ABD3JNM1_EUCGL
MEQENSTWFMLGRGVNNISFEHHILQAKLVLQVAKLTSSVTLGMHSRKQTVIFFTFLGEVKGEVIFVNSLCSFWAAHLVSPTWGPFASCIILSCIGTNKDGGYLAPKWLFLCMYMGLTFIRFIGGIVGGIVIVIMLPLVALTTQSYSLYGNDAAAHLTEETKGADKNGSIAILTGLEINLVFGWAYILAFTFSIQLCFACWYFQNFDYLYDLTNDTIGVFIPAQILYDAFHGWSHSVSGANILLFIIWGSFCLGRLSITTSAASMVYALSRDKGIPFSSIWRKAHPKHKVPSNAVWLCAAVCVLIGIPILKVNVVFTTITSKCRIGWVSGYVVTIFGKMVMEEKNFKPGPFYLGKASRAISLTVFLWMYYTCSVFLLLTLYPLLGTHSPMNQLIGRYDNAFMDV